MPEVDPATLSSDQLDGIACIACGGREGAMVPVTAGALGVLFRHLDRCPGVRRDV